MRNTHSLSTHVVFFPVYNQVNHLHLPLIYFDRYWTKKFLKNYLMFINQHIHSIYDKHSNGIMLLNVIVKFQTVEVRKVKTHIVCYCKLNCFANVVYSVFIKSLIALYIFSKQCIMYKWFIVQNRLLICELVLCSFESMCCLQNTSTDISSMIHIFSLYEHVIIFM